jgi:hypothetical protein
MAVTDFYVVIDIISQNIYGESTTEVLLSCVSFGHLNYSYNTNIT